MGGTIRLDVLGVGYNKYAIAYAPVTGGQKITGSIDIAVEIEQIATALAGSATAGNGACVLLFVDDSYNMYWLYGLLLRTHSSGADFYPYNPDIDVVGSRIASNDATHYLDTSQCTYNADGAIAKQTKTITIDPTAAGVFNVSPLYLIYVMFDAVTGGDAGSIGWRGNFYSIKVTQ